MADLKEYVTTAQAARYLGCDRSTVLRYIRKGYLKAEKVGPNYVIERCVLRSFVPPKPGNPLLRRDNGPN